MPCPWATSPSARARRSTTPAGPADPPSATTTSTFARPHHAPCLQTTASALCPAAAVTLAATENSPGIEPEVQSRIGGSSTVPAPRPPATTHHAHGSTRTRPCRQRIVESSSTRATAGPPRDRVGHRTPGARRRPALPRLRACRGCAAGIWRPQHAAPRVRAPRWRGPVGSPSTGSRVSQVKPVLSPSPWRRRTPRRRGDAPRSAPLTLLPVHRSDRRSTHSSLQCGVQGAAMVSRRGGGVLHGMAGPQDKPQPPGYFVGPIVC
jgi:hypothetical protein